MSDIIAPANADEKNIAVVTHITGIFSAFSPASSSGS